LHQKLPIKENTRAAVARTIAVTPTHSLLFIPNFMVVWLYGYLVGYTERNMELKAKDCKQKLKKSVKSQLH